MDTVPLEFVVLEDVVWVIRLKVRASDRVSVCLPPPLLVLVFPVYHKPRSDEWDTDMTGSRIIGILFSQCYFYTLKKYEICYFNNKSCNASCTNMGFQKSLHNFSIHSMYPSDFFKIESYIFGTSVVQKYFHLSSISLLLDTDMAL